MLKSLTHPLSKHFELEDEGDWNLTFLNLWKDGLEITDRGDSTRFRSSRQLDNVNVVEVCDKLEKLLMLTVVDKGTEKFCLNYIDATVYLKGLALLCKKKGEILRSSVLQLLDPKVWIAFTGNDLDVKNVPPSRVNMPAKSHLPSHFSHFESDFQFELSTFDADIAEAKNLIRRLEADEDLRGRVIQEVSLDGVFSITDVEIERRLANITIAEVPVPAEDEDSGPSLGKNTAIKYNPLDPEGVPLDSITAPEPLADETVPIPDDVDGAEVPTPEVTIVKRKGRAKRWDTLSNNFLYTDEKFEQMEENYEKTTTIRKEPKQKPTTEKAWELFDKPFPILTTAQEKTKMVCLQKKETTGSKALTTPGLASPVPMDATEDIPLLPPLALSPPIQSPKRKDNIRKRPSKPTTTAPVAVTDIPSPCVEPGPSSPMMMSGSIIEPDETEFTAEDILYYGFDPTDAKSILDKINNETVDVYELAPPGVWTATHVGILVFKLVDMAKRGYIDLKNEGEKLLVIPL